MMFYAYARATDGNAYRAYGRSRFEALRNLREMIPAGVSALSHSVSVGVAAAGTVARKDVFV